MFCRAVRPRWPWVIVGSLGLAVTFSLLVAIFISPHDVTNAKVGDCVRNDGSSTDPSVHILSCSDPGAAFKVFQTMNSGNVNDCDSVADSVAEYMQTVKGDDSSDLLICLGSNPR